jgi:hypothetical protein
MLLELVCIRWVPAYVSLFGFFINFVLLGSLLGGGVGMLSSPRLKLPIFPVLLLIFVIFVWIFHDRFSIPTGSMLFYGTDARSHGWWRFLPLPAIFLLRTLLFMPLGRILAGAFNALPPLEGYRLDIVGSLAGISVFTALSWFSTPPWCGSWFWR